MASGVSEVPVRPLRPIRPFAVVATVLMGLFVIAGVVAPFVGGLDEVGVSGVCLITSVGFLAWLLRARANSYAISPGVLHTYAAVFLVAGWILPILNLFVPKGIIDDIWATSQPGGQPPGRDLSRVRRSGLVWAWWLTCLASGGAGLCGRYADLGAWNAPVLLAALGLWVVAGGLAIAVVLKITALQENARAAR
ncbi:DUF4328 domain-containing protein [Nonomuraea sp. NPDC003727]